MRIYLDNNATTPLHPAVLQAISSAMEEHFGNPSSVHREGQLARRMLEESREALAALLGVEPREVIYTSGGSESNNAAIHGFVSPGKRSRIVTTSIEHPSVAEPLSMLEQDGVAEIVRVEPGTTGRVAASAMIEAVDAAETSLVVMMLANNETGVMQPVSEVAAACRDRGIPLHCDAVQAAGRIPVDADALGATSLSISAHKMHGPKGIGALYVRRGTVLRRLVSGGAQERRRRAGTEAVPLAVGFAAAARLVGSEGMEEMRKARDRFEQLLMESIPEAIIHGSAVERIPNTSSVHIPGIDAQSLVIALDLRGVAISTGSACSSGRVEPSRVLIEMGLSVEDARSSIRVSVGRLTTADEIDRAVRLLSELVPSSRAAASGAGGTVETR
ncbi:MAG TPA: cysteine desulfurase family protein [Thermoanaerobaculia bacterium]|nr:cysteine desulfurase family protein [Thermoanaerobaculia bacterium]